MMSMGKKQSRPSSFIAWLTGARAPEQMSRKNRPRPIASVKSGGFTGDNTGAISMSGLGGQGALDTNQ